MTASVLAERAAAPGPPALDGSQRAVLDLPPTASALVLGAPGSGRTTTLVELSAARLVDGLDPDELLVLAPHRQAATRLRDRLAERWDRTLTGPAARTPTSLAFSVVRRAAALAGQEPPTLLTGGEQDAVLRELLAGHVADGTGPAWPAPLSADVLGTRRFRGELRETLMRATEYGIDPHRMRALAARYDEPRWAAAAAFAEEYEGVIASARGSRLDLAELLAFAVAAIERGDGGDAIDRLRLVLVDDAQEATRATLELIGAIARRGVPVVAFGEPDIAANAFRGGQADALGGFAARLGSDTTVLTLREVHRHGGPVRALVRTVAERIGAAGVDPARRSALPAADAPERTEVAVLTASTSARQWAGVARELRDRHLRGGSRWSDLVVVVRGNASIPVAARALALAEVPTRTTTAARPIRDAPAARALLAMLDTALGSRELTGDLARDLLTSAFGGLDVVGLRRLRTALRAEELAGDGVRSADALLADALAEPGRLVTLDTREARAAARLATLLAAVRTAAASGASVDELLWRAWDGSAPARQWRTEALGAGIPAVEANRALDAVLALFSAAKRFVERRPGDPPQLFLASLADAEVADDALVPQQGADAVLVATPAALVGTEFDTVVVGDLQEGVWPNLSLRGSLLGSERFLRVAQGLGEVQLDDRHEVLGDELRMFALAVSRARSRVLLAAVSNDDESPSVLTALAGEGARRIDANRARPLTLRGLTGALRRELLTGGAEQRGAAARGLARLAEEGLPGAHPDSWHGLLEVSTDALLYAADDEVPLSPSKLDALEQNPLHWFIDRIATQPPSPHTAFGRVIHYALETADGTAEGLWNAVASRWGELAFESPWLGEQQRATAKRMTLAIADYLRQTASAGRTLVAAEGSFELRHGRAVLRGTIDRVEQSGDGAVVIVDLKTGSTMPTAAETAAHGQLSAYQLAYETGAIDGLAHPHSNGGASLLYVRKGGRGRLFTERPQGPLDADGLDAFRARVDDAVRTMSAASFTGQVDLDDFAPGTARFSWHVVKAVSSD